VARPPPVKAASYAYDTRTTAASWVGKNGGATLETTLAREGISLPPWDPTNPSVVSAWHSAAQDFAAGASGNVRVLQTDAVRINSVWAQVEFPALKANPKVTSITAIDPRNGAEVLLWSR
jgi:filamentous hemagglutinin